VARRHLTAIGRQALSRPVRVALDARLLSGESRLLDYGCGRGDDLRELDARGIESFGWDPVHRPDGGKREADVVNLGYVVNVIEDAREREEALRDAWSYAQKVLLVSARLTLEAKGLRTETFRDGCLTSKGTFQKFYTQHELREWIDSTLGVRSIAAAPGIFFVFRDDAAREAFAASRFRRRAAVPRQRQADVLFDRHKELLQPLMDFYAERGRLPEGHELTNADEVGAAFGSLKRAFAVVRRATGEEQWRQLEEERRQDLLVYVALEAFGRRPKLSVLPADMQLDIRAFFGKYTRACQLADELLFSAGSADAIDAACQEAPCGKLTQDSLYVHLDALLRLPPLLRVYEGCARAYFGHVDDANVIKLSRRRARVSYLSYPDFETDPHPALHSSLLVSLGDLEVSHRDYTGRDNPPILHRKEGFLPPDHPLRPKFARLTQQEERAGLYEDPTAIGTREKWNHLVHSKGLHFIGHRLTKV
jgi:DNA phosphorothioation-associated putative methyltransferase